MSLLLTELVIVTVGWYMVGRHSFDLGALSRVGRVAIASGALWAVAQPCPRSVRSPLAAAGAAFLVLGAALRIPTPGELAQARALARRVRRRLPGGSPA